jgi:Na+/H+-dicarboxylate symporter
MRFRRALWSAAVIAAWLGALLGASQLDQDGGMWYVGLGVPLTMLVGAVLGRWWVPVVPWVVTAVWLTAAYVSDPSCSDCADPDDLGGVFIIMLVLFTIPATVALAIGVAARRLTRFFQKPESS